MVAIMIRPATVASAVSLKFIVQHPVLKLDGFRGMWLGQIKEHNLSGFGRDDFE